jgi:hypothetical protein
VILGYTYEEAAKTVAQIISAVLLLVGFFIVFDPSLEASLIAVSTAVFGVIAVFGAKQATADDWSKAVQSLAASVIGVVGVFTTVDPTTAEKWGTIVALLIPPIWVWVKGNHPSVIGAPVDPVVDPALASRRVR